MRPGQLRFADDAAGEVRLPSVIVGGRICSFSLPDCGSCITVAAMPRTADAQHEFGSWKEIAEYLGITVRTAQKWEAERGLPVRRLPGLKGRVSADRAELDRWREATLGKSGWWASLTALRLYAAAATALLLVCASIFVGLYFGGNRKGPPSRFRLDSKVLTVTDDRGRELWRWTFPDEFRPGTTPESLRSERRASFGDVDGDGRIEMLFVYDPVSRDKAGTTLFCFSEKGEVKWRFTPGGTVRTPGPVFDLPYVTERLVVLRQAGRPGQAVLVTSHHITFYPNQVALLSGDGRLVGEYWHSGHLSKMDAADLDGDGIQEVLLAGVNNGYKAATLVVLDPREIAGASAEEDAQYQIQGFGPAKEKARILFPRTCINRKLEDYSVARQLSVQPGVIQVGTHERLIPELDTGGVIYLFTWALELKGVDFSDRLRVLHREMELTGALDHPFSQREVEELRGQVRVIRGKEQ